MAKESKERLLFGVYAVDDCETDISVSVNVKNEDDLKKLLGGFVEFALDSDTFMNILSTAILCIESFNDEKKERKHLTS